MEVKMALSWILCLAVAKICFVVSVWAYNDPCYSWSLARWFFIETSSLDPSAVLHRVERRSFVECLVECDVSQGCSGVAYKDGECSTINGTAAAPQFVRTDVRENSFKVMLFSSNDSQV